MPSLFTRDDEVEAEWSLITPILEVTGPRSQSPQALPNYAAAGSWGPEDADKMVTDSGRKLVEPVTCLPTP